MRKVVLWELILFQSLATSLWSMDKDNRAHNHQILIAQTQKIDILQVVTSNKDTYN